MYGAIFGKGECPRSDVITYANGALEKVDVHILCEVERVLNPVTRFFEIFIEAWQSIIYNIYH